MCTPKKNKALSNQAAPPPEQVADRLMRDPAKGDPLSGQRGGKSKLVINRAVGGLDRSGLTIK